VSYINYSRSLKESLLTDLNNSCTAKLVLSLRRELSRTLAEVTLRRKGLIKLRLVRFLLKLFVKLNFLFKNEKISILIEIIRIAKKEVFL
jgi:hypothetical protein